MKEDDKNWEKGKGLIRLISGKPPKSGDQVFPSAGQCSSPPASPIWGYIDIGDARCDVPFRPGFTFGEVEWGNETPGEPSFVLKPKLIFY